MILNLRMVTKNRLTEKKKFKNRVISFEQELASSCSLPGIVSCMVRKSKKTLKTVNNHDLI